jgi:tRNA A-37 threonylcarbamoyl transferase component Bud32
VKHVSSRDGLELAQLATADQIDLVCDAFEAALIRDETPRIEDFLDRCEASVRESLLAELLLVDREFRIKRGEIASRHDYQRRFPGYSTVIDGLEFPTIDDRGGKGSPASRAQPAANPGDQIAHFELVVELGSGASGTVWKARDTRLRRLVAIKMPRQGRLTDAERDRFLREGQACAQLRHPDIVAVHEVGEDRGRAFIVAEFIDGLNLRQWLDQHRPKPREAAELTAQLAEALHHAHEQGVIHRDLKPANVLIDHEGHPHVTDFGLAKWTADSAGMTIEGNILGTPAYMSPEQARGDAFRVDRRTDVYSLGALLYEMLTGRAPFAGETAVIVHQVIHDEPRPPRKIQSRIPRDLETICLKAMEKEQSRRYPSAQEMAVDLWRYLRGEQILSRRVGLMTKGWRFVRRRPAVAVSAVLTVFIALAGFAVASLMEQNRILEGYRHVRVETVPAGAVVAFVPLDDRTGEPNPDPAAIIRPPGVTPLEFDVKAARYFVEAVLPGNPDHPDFAEVQRNVPKPGTAPAAVIHKFHGNGNLVRLQPIEIKPSEDAIEEMVCVPIDEAARRKNPLLPKMLYVDAKEITADDDRAWVRTTGDGTSYIPFNGAASGVEGMGKRLPSAAEYDVISTFGKFGKHREANGSDSKAPSVVDDLLGGAPEWTTSRYVFSGKEQGSVDRLSDRLILKGYDRADVFPHLLRSADGQLLGSQKEESPLIGFRGVRSGAPRFVTE